MESVTNRKLDRMEQKIIKKIRSKKDYDFELNIDGCLIVTCTLDDNYLYELEKNGIEFKPYFDLHDKNYQRKRLEEIINQIETKPEEEIDRAGFVENSHPQFDIRSDCHYYDTNELRFRHYTVNIRPKSDHYIFYYKISSDDYDYISNFTFDIFKMVIEYPNIQTTRELIEKSPDIKSSDKKLISKIFEKYKFTDGEIDYHFLYCNGMRKSGTWKVLT